MTRAVALAERRWTGPTIPRVIHQTYSSAVLPDALRANVEELTHANPGWEHRFYDADARERYIRDAYGADILRLYRRIDPAYAAARADLFRYLLIYREGGVYLDIKSRFTRPIDEVLRGDEAFVVSRWSNLPGEPHEGYGLHAELPEEPRGEIQQWHVIAAPGHPFLHAVIARVLAGIDRYRPWRDHTGKLGVLKLTGPIAYTRAISPLLDRHPCTIIPDERALALQYSIFEGDGHFALFPRHYTQSRAPVVRMTGLHRPACLVWLAARAVKQRLLPSSEGSA